MGFTTARFPRRRVLLDSVPRIAANCRAAAAHAWFKARTELVEPID
jgi:hypothetical protein